MSRGSLQKQKILYVKKILLEETDDTHGITVPEIIKKLGNYGISAERKSIYDDLRTLENYGLDICRKRSKTVTYYIGNRDFEMPELKLLVDAVQSSKFITHKKSMGLIKKVGHLASKHESKHLQRQVFVTNRVKTPNEKIYYNVDTIHNAITENKKITFKYLEWKIEFGSISKIKKLPRRDGKDYIVSPMGLVWYDENYYLVGYDSVANIKKHYRVDKMDEIKISKERRSGKLDIQNFDIAIYCRNVFGMYGGKLANIRLKAHNNLIGVIVDRFGREIFITRADKEHFYVDLSIKLSPQFFGWLCGIGSKIKIVSPEKPVEEFKKYVKEIYDLYV